MVKYPNYLSGSQDDINKRLLEMILKLQKENTGEGADITELESDVGALQTAVGGATSGLVKDVADLESAIGDESTADTILYRIKALEDAE